jgi:hypothetical protein
MACDCSCIFITFECLDSHTPLNGHMNQGEIREAFCNAHDIYLRGVIGDTCYDEMCEAVKEVNNDMGAEGLAQRWKDLAAASEKFIAWATYRDWIEVYGRSKSTAKGEKDQTSEGSATVSPEDFARKFSNILMKFSIYRDDVVKFLKDNDDTYSCRDSNDETGVCNDSVINREEEDSYLGIDIV